MRAVEFYNRLGIKECIDVLQGLSRNQQKTKMNRTQAKKQTVHCRLSIRHNKGCVKSNLHNNND